MTARAFERRRVGRTDKTRRPDDDLNDVHRTSGEPIQLQAEVGGEGVERHIAAVE